MWVLTSLVKQITCVCQWLCYLRIHSQTLSRQAEKSRENRTISVFLRSALCLSSAASRRLIFITYTVRQKKKGEVKVNQKNGDGDRWRGTQAFSLPTCLLRMMNSIAAPPSSSGLQFSITLNTDRKTGRPKDRQKEKDEQQRNRKIENLLAIQPLP